MGCVPACVCFDCSLTPVVQVVLCLFESAPEESGHLPRVTRWSDQNLVPSATRGHTAVNRCDGGLCHRPKAHLQPQPTIGQDLPG